MLYLYIQVRKGESFRKVPTGHVSSSWSRSSLLIISVALGHIPRSWSRPSLLVTSLALGHVPRSWSRPSLLVASLALGHVPRSWSRLRQVKARACDNCSVSARFGPPGSARPVACARSRPRVPGPVPSGGSLSLLSMSLSFLSLFVSLSLLDVVSIHPSPAGLLCLRRFRDVTPS